MIRKCDKCKTGIATGNLYHHIDKDKDLCLDCWNELNINKEKVCYGNEAMQEIINSSKTRVRIKKCIDCDYEKDIRAEALKEVEKIVNDWYDVGIDLPNSNLQLMATNGGYIKKFDLLKKLKEVSK